jgi:glycine/D-amino acid oxidase-like deaminating enzyme
MKSMDSNAVNNAVVICGAGVIGTATAYFLARRGIAVRIVERCAVACAASGKAGGFLALDWCDGSPLSGLARKSFELHAELARTPGFDYGYRRLTTVAVTAREGGTKFSAQARPEFNWLNGNGAVCSSSDGIGGSRFSRNVRKAIPKYPRAEMIRVIQSSTKW